MKRCPVCGADPSERPDKIEKLFNLWRKRPFDGISIVSMGERMLVERMLAEFSYERVTEAFIEASSEPQRMKLSYVRGILRGDIKKQEISLAKKQSAEVQKIAPEKIGGFDFSEITKPFSKEKEQTAPEVKSVKKSRSQEEYEEAKRRFEEDLKREESS